MAKSYVSSEILAIRNVLGLERDAGTFASLSQSQIDYLTYRRVFWFVFASIAVWILIDGYKLRRFHELPNSDTHVKCPDCKELILKDASVCKHCGCKVIPHTGKQRL